MCASRRITASSTPPTHDHDTGISVPDPSSGDGSIRRSHELDLPVRHHRPRRIVALLIVLALVAGWQAIGASAQSVDDLRGDIPTGDAVRDELAEIADTDLAVAPAAGAADVVREQESLDLEQRRLAAEIEAATDNLRRVAVEAFITGGDVGSLEYLASVGGASDFSWRQYLVRSHAGSSRVAVNRLRALRLRAGDAVLATIDQAESLRATIGEIELSLITLADREDELNEVLPFADAWDRAVAVAEGGGIAPLIAGNASL